MSKIWTDFVYCHGCASRKTAISSETVAHQTRQDVQVASGHVARRERNTERREARVRVQAEMSAKRAACSAGIWKKKKKRKKENEIECEADARNVVIKRDRVMQLGVGAAASLLGTNAPTRASMRLLVPGSVSSLSIARSLSLSVSLSLTSG